MLFGAVKTLRVLVIEDDALITLMLTEVLGDMGHGVCATAATPTEAIEAARQHDPDLIISDATLRNGSGIAAVEEIQKSKRLPHLFMTGDPMGVRLALPDAVVIRKPFSAAALFKAIEKALEASVAS